MLRIVEYVKEFWRNVRMFFPLVLLIHHLKHNLLGLFYWLFFFAIITDNLGRGFGISYLFLSPEYRGAIGFLSFLFVGFSFGGLTMAFHSYSYARLAPYFPFLAMVNKPFVKFSLNNSFIPVVFSVLYIYRMVVFQRAEEYAVTTDLWEYAIGYVLGFTLFVGISILYFFPINKNVFELNKIQDIPAKRILRWQRFSKGRSVKWKADKRHRIYWYLGRRMKIQKCRSTKHYQPQLLQAVFEQNRISTSVFEITTISAFVLLGWLGGGTYFDIPAAVSVVLLLTIVLMLFSALLAWMRFWTYPLLIAVLIVMNICSVKYGWFEFETNAYGMDYEREVMYSPLKLQQMYADSVQMNKDYQAYIRMLENWKLRTGQKKPVLVVVNTSGGGSRSAAWVFEVLRKCDSLSSGANSKHIAMITGASGGMVGAAYYRSLVMAHENVDEPVYYERIASDLLNKLAFAASTNDLFFRYQATLRGNEKATYDRALAFEQDLNENTENRLAAPLVNYKKAERSGKIPVMIFTPTVVNDGRRLVLSSQPMSFLNKMDGEIKGLEGSYEYVDGQQLFGAKQVENVRMSSVLRMNATFPYVLPMTTLPTQPAIQVMDAGTRDNFGGKMAVQWLFVLKDWIRENTSGVVLLQIRDTKKVIYGDGTRSLTFLDRFSEPFGNVLSNFPRTQDLDQDELITAFGKQAPFPFQVATFNLRTESSDRISLSWHLTSHEKRKIKQAIFRSSNRQTMNRLMKLLCVK